MKCDICGLEHDTGYKHYVTCYEDHQTLFRKRWTVVKRRRKIFVCRKCADMLCALIKSHRKERVT